MEQCKYCKNFFTTIYKLNKHQQTAKYCLKIQGKVLICDCKKNFTDKRNLEKHQKKCVDFHVNRNTKQLEEKYNGFISHLKNIIDEKDQMINELQNKLDNLTNKIADKPTTINTINIIQNLQPLSDSDFQNNLDNLTIDYINRGALGYAQYALEYPLKDKIICVDYSRRKVKFKDKDGNMITDPEMSSLATKFFQSIKDKNKNLIYEHGLKLREKFGDEIEKIAELLEVESAVSKAANGEKGDFHQEFVKNVCSQIVIK